MCLQIWGCNMDNNGTSLKEPQIFFKIKICTDVMSDDVLVIIDDRITNRIATKSVPTVVNALRSLGMVVWELAKRLEKTGYHHD